MRKTVFLAVGHFFVAMITIPYSLFFSYFCLKGNDTQGIILKSTELNCHKTIAIDITFTCHYFVLFGWFLPEKV